MQEAPVKVKLATNELRCNFNLNDLIVAMLTAHANPANFPWLPEFLKRWMRCRVDLCRYWSLLSVTHDISAEEKALHSTKGCACQAGFKPRVGRIINEFLGQAEGFQTVHWTVLLPTPTFRASPWPSLPPTGWYRNRALFRGRSRLCPQLAICPCLITAAGFCPCAHD